MTFRMRGHEEASGVAYVRPHLFEEWAARDPVARFESRCSTEGALTTADRDAIRAALKAHIDQIADEASRRRTRVDGRSGSWPTCTRRPAATPREAATARARAQRGAPASALSAEPPAEAARRHAARDALHRCHLRRPPHRDAPRPRVLLMGQDIAEYGGVFKVTEGFVEEFGKARVRNTPIIESGALGARMGLALDGCGRWSRCSSATSSRAASTRSSTTSRRRTTAGASGCRW